MVLILSAGEVFAQPDEDALGKKTGAQRSAAAPPERILDFVGTWEYRWGDSPRDDNGFPLWAAPAQREAAAGTAPQAEAGWHSLGRTAIPRPPGRQGQNFLWLRTRLFGPDLYDPTLELELLNQIFEAYLEGQLIYRFGKLDGTGKDARRFLGYPPHLLKLGERYQDRTLTLRIYSEHINIGIGRAIRLGTKSEIILDTVRKDTGKGVIGSALCVIGLFVLGLYLTQRRRLTYLCYGGFTFTMGAWLVCQLKSRDLLLGHPLLWTHVEIFSLYTSAAFLAWFMADVLGRGPLGLMPVVAWALTLYEVLAALLVATGVVPIMRTLLPFEVGTLFIIAYTTFSIGLLLRQRNIEAWMFGIGFIIAMTLAAYDILGALGVVARLEPRLSHFGQGFFAMMLGFILIRRFQLMQTDLLLMRHALSEKVNALEVRNAEIENLNLELRHQIEARSKQFVTSLIGNTSTSGEDEVPIFPDGALINQRYRVIRMIGQGSMGVVYEVERVHDHRRFAAKVLSGRTHRRELARFAREAQLLAHLKHHNLVTIADVELTDSRLAYIIMELVDGKTLEEQSARFTDLTFAIPILRQLADALAKVHGEGIVHRDLKPSKVFSIEKTRTGFPNLSEALGEIGMPLSH